MSDLSTRFLKLQTRSTFCKELVPLEISKRTSWKTDVRHFCVLFEDTEASIWAAHSNRKKGAGLKSRHKGKKSYLIKWFLSDSKWGLSPGAFDVGKVMGCYQNSIKNFSCLTSACGITAGYQPSGRANSPSMIPEPPAEPWELRLVHSLHSARLGALNPADRHTA